MYTKYTHSENDDGKEEEYPHAWIGYFDKNHEAHIKIVNDELEKGTEVELRYDPDDPDEAIADDYDAPPMNTFLFGLFGMAAGVISFLIGRFVLW